MKETEKQNAATVLWSKLYHGEAMAKPPEPPSIHVARYIRGRFVATLERVAHPDPCSGCENADCPHHGSMVRKRARRAARTP